MEKTSDIETGSTTSFSSAGPGLRRTPVYLNMTASKIDEFRRDYSIEPIVQPTSYLNEHPHLAYERGHLEQKLVKEMHKTKWTIMDVGSSPKRMVHHPHVRCLVPQIQDGDESRLRGFANNPKVCTHKLQDYFVNLDNKTCANCVSTDVMVMTHSGYYFSAAEYAMALTKCKQATIFVIGHLFPLPIGGFYGEAVYNVKDGVVAMRAFGNHHTYRHPKLPWDGSSGFEYQGRWYAAEVHARIGVTYCWRVYGTVRYVPEIIDMSPWEDVLIDDKHSGPIMIPDFSILKQSNLMSETVGFQLTRLVGSGPFLECGTTTKTVIVPRGAVAFVAFHLIGRPRDGALYRTATFHAKQYIEPTNLPQEHKGLAAITAAVLGMQLLVKDEVAMLHHAVTHSSALWRAHTTLLALGPIKTYSLYTLAFLLFCTVIADILADHYLPSPRHEIFWGFLGLCCFLLLLLLCMFAVRNRALMREGDGWHSTLLHEQRTTPVTQTLYVPPLVLPPAINLAEAVAQEPESWITVHPDPRPPKNPATPTANLRLVAAAIDTAVPTYSPNTQAAEIVAVQNRITLAKLPIDRVAIQRYERVVMEGENFHFTFRILDDDAAADAWLKRAPGNIKALAEALQYYKAQGPNCVKHTARCFLKRDEKLNKVGQNGQAAFTPRMISSFSDLHKVATGPFVWAFSNDLCKYWNGIDSCIYYTRGSTSESVGSVVQQWIDENGVNMIVYMNDYVKLDGSIVQQHTSPFLNKYKECGANANTLKVLKGKPTTKGWTRHGVEFESQTKQIGSGANATSLEGTEVNVASHETVYEPPISKSRRDLMLALGDDGALFRRGEHQDTHPETIPSRFEALGLRVKMQVCKRLSDVEFCSKIFLPTEDGLVLSPKPGRAFVKLGWTLSQVPDTLYGDLMGAMKDSHHVPFLRKYVARLRELVTRPKKGPDKTRHRDWEIHCFKYHECTEATFQVFYERYGLTREDEEAFANEVKSIVKLPCVIKSDLIARMIEKDNQ